MRDFTGFVFRYRAWFLFVFCCCVSFVILKAYVSAFREYPIYADIRDIMCGRADIVPVKQSGGRFSSRDRKIFNFEGGVKLKASLNIEQPVVSDVSGNSFYYTSILSGDLSGYYVCYILLEDHVLNDNHQIVYISKLSDSHNFDDRYVERLAYHVGEFNSWTSENGFWYFAKIYIAFLSVLFGFSGVALERYVDKIIRREIS